MLKKIFSIKKSKIILKASKRISLINAKNDNALAFLAPPLVQVTLPHKDPGNIHVWGKVNGNLSFTIYPGFKENKGKLINIGLPYGTIPRILLIWITGEAIKKNSREIILGESLSNFIKKLNLNSENGGLRSDFYRLKLQVQKLFSSRISFNYSHDKSFIFRNHFDVAESICMFSSNINKKKIIFRIILGENFFKQVIKKPVPIDLRAIIALKQSPLAIDLYIWLTYRVSYLKKVQFIKWFQLQNQFGSNYKRVRDLKKKIMNILIRIKLIYPNLKIDENMKGIIIYPSPSHVKKNFFN